VKFLEMQKSVPRFRKWLSSIKDTCVEYVNRFIKSANPNYREAYDVMFKDPQTKLDIIVTQNTEVTKTITAMNSLKPTRRPRKPQVAVAEAPHVEPRADSDVAPTPAQSNHIADANKMVPDQSGDANKSFEAPPTRAPRGAITPEILAKRIESERSRAERMVNRIDKQSASGYRYATNKLDKLHKALAKISTSPAGRKQGASSGVGISACISSETGREDALLPAPLSFPAAPPLPAMPAGLHNQDAEQNGQLWADAPQWQRDHAAKKLDIITATKGMNTKAIEAYVAQHNTANPDATISYSMVIRAKNAYEAEGLAGLFPNYGKQDNAAEIKPEWLAYFKQLYMKEGGPSKQTVWLSVVGKFKADPKTFPTAKTFMRRLLQHEGKNRMLRARIGANKWYRYHSPYCDRDYSGIKAGECWVSDHAQIDVGVRLPNKSTCYPWVTAWRDFKSGKMLAYFIHPAAPNADHIFHSFYLAARKFGLPKMVYLDNGKDYRCRDFAGGRQDRHKVSLTVSHRSTIAALGIEVIFAKPYNARTKPIERDFLKIKDTMSRMFPEFRGGNTQERPDGHAAAVTRDGCTTLEQLEQAAASFIEEYFNIRPSARSKVLKGLSPNELWNKEFIENRHISAEAIKLFVMRTSTPRGIDRNGVRDPELGIDYWAEWMTDRYRDKVYLRRNPENYTEAWVFDAKDDSFISMAYADKFVTPAIATDAASKEVLRENMARQKRSIKMVENGIKSLRPGDPVDDINNLIAGQMAINVATGHVSTDTAVRITRMTNTMMDKVVKTRRAQEQEGMYDLSLTAPTKPVEPPMKEWFYETTEEMKDDE